MRSWGPPKLGWQNRSHTGCGWSSAPPRRRIADLAELSSQTASSSASVDDDPKHKLQRAEAVLILSRGPLTTRKLAALAGLADATEARTLIRQLNQIYDENGRSFRAEEVAGGYQLLTRSQFSPYLRRLGHTPQTIRLSSPTLETLAIVAYRQPIMRADIEAVRGVQSGELLRQLMERDLVRISGRSEELGRPYLYSTTKRFLQVFGLRNTDALPCAEWFIDQPETESQSSAPVSDSSEKESNVSIAIASASSGTDQETQDTVTVIPVNGTVTSDSAPRSEIDDEDWEEESDDEDDWDDEEEDGDWDEDEEGDDEEWDEDEEGETEEGDDDDDWEEVDDEEGDEEWDEDESDDDEEEEDGEWVEDEDDDDWDDDDEGEF